MFTKYDTSTAGTLVRFIHWTLRDEAVLRRLESGIRTQRAGKKPFSVIGE
jgi:hypothetical protein